MKWTVGCEVVVSARQYTNAWRWPIWENELVMPKACGKALYAILGVTGALISVCASA